MEAEFWHERWNAGQTMWDQADPHRFLPRTWPAVGCPDGGTVFVPLCGKSVDMVWLAERGHRVVGVELSDVGVAEFFERIGADAERREEGPFSVWSAGPYELWAGDVFELPGHALDGVDAVYDRASLVALDPDLRRRYADQLTAIVPDAAPILVLAFEYDEGEMDGPPFSVSRDEIRSLFSVFDAESIEHQDALASNPDLGARGLTALAETATVLRRGGPGQTR